MFGDVRFNPSVSRVNYNHNFEMPVNTSKFVTNAVNEGAYNLSHPRKHDSDGLREVLGTTVSPVANRLDYLC